MNFNSLFSIFGKKAEEAVVAESKSFSTYGGDGVDAKAFIARGVTKVTAGDYSGAIRDFDKALQLEPMSPDAHLERSKAKRALNDERGADQDLSEFKIMFDRLDNGLKANDAAGAAYDAGNYKDAVRHYNKANTYSIFDMHLL